MRRSPHDDRNTAGVGPPACLAICNGYIGQTTYTLEEEPLSLPAFRARVRKITASYPFFVAKDERGETVGYAYLSAFNERGAYRVSADLSIYVAQNARRGGIGDALLSAIESAAGDYGIRTLISLVTSENEPSVRFHEKHGFLPEGTLHDVAVKFGRSLGVTFFRKPLVG